MSTKFNFDLSDNYNTRITDLNDTLKSISKWDFIGTEVDIPVGTKRLNPTTFFLENWDGSSWVNASINFGNEVIINEGLIINKEQTPSIFLNRIETDTTLQLAASVNDVVIASNSGKGMLFYTNDQSSMYINSYGNVGIGTNSPLARLNVVSDDSYPARFGTTTSNSFINIYNSITGTTTSDGLVIGIDSNADAYIINRENSSLRFSTNNSENMRIESTGNIGIGTTSPANFLAGTKGIAIYDTTYPALGIARATNDYWLMFSGNQNELAFYHNNGSGNTPMRITHGRMAVGNLNPDSYYSANQLVVGNVGSSGCMTIVSSESDYGYILFADGTSGDSIYKGQIFYSHGSDSMHFRTNGTTDRLTINNAGDLNLNTGNLYLPNNKGYYIKDSNGTSRNVVYVDAANNQYIGSTSLGNMYLQTPSGSKVYHYMSGSENHEILSDVGKVFASSYGYQKLSNGLVLMWGITDAIAIGNYVSGEITETFTTGFQNACLNVTANPTTTTPYVGVGATANVSITAMNKDYFKFQFLNTNNGNNNLSFQVMWMAIGY